MMSKIVEKQTTFTKIKIKTKIKTKGVGRKRVNKKTRKQKISYITICEARAITSCRSLPSRISRSPIKPSPAFHELRSLIATGPPRTDCDSYESFPSGKFLLLKAKFDHDRRGCAVNWLIGLLWTRWWMKFVVGSLHEFSAMKVVVGFIRLLIFFSLANT